MTDRSTSAGVIHAIQPPPLPGREELAVVARMAHLADRVGNAFLFSFIFVCYGVTTSAFELRAVFNHDAALLVGFAAGIFLLMLSILLFSPRSLLIIAVWLLALAASGFAILYFNQPRIAFLLLGLAATSLASLVSSVMAYIMHRRLNAAVRESRLSWSDCRRLAMYWFAFRHRGWSSSQIWSRPWLATPEKTTQVCFTLLDDEMLVEVGRDRGFGSNTWFSGRDSSNFVPCPAESGQAAFVVTFIDTTGTLLVRADEGEAIRAWVERRSSPPECFSLSAYREFRSMALAYARKAVPAEGRP